MTSQDGGFGIKSIPTLVHGGSSRPLLIDEALVFPLPLGDGSLRHVDGLKIRKSKHKNGERDSGGSKFKDSSVRGFGESSILTFPLVYLRSDVIAMIILCLN